MAKLTPAIAKKFQEQRDKVALETQINTLITKCHVMLEGKGIKQVLLPENEKHVWSEVLRHFACQGWNISIEKIDNREHFSIWID